jgi:hypothetical protein
VDNAHNPPANLTADGDKNVSPFDNTEEEEIDTELDSSLKPAQLYARIFGASAAQPKPKPEPQAEELEPGEMCVPLKMEMGCGKQLKTGNKRYGKSYVTS